MRTLLHQQQIRELSERYLTSAFRGTEAHSVSHPTGQNKPENFSTNLSGVVESPASGEIHPSRKRGSGSSAPPAQNLPGPSTIEELSEALRNPLPEPPPRPRCYDALEAFASYKPLTLEMVSDLLAKERAARDEIIAEYVKRTGQQVEYCDQCDMGVTEEEHEEGWQIVVTPTKCENCDGLGVVKL